TSRRARRVRRRRTYASSPDVTSQPKRDPLHTQRILSFPPFSGLLTLQVRDQRGPALRRLLLDHVDQLPAVLAEGVEDVPRVVRKERRHEVLPLLHRSSPLRSSAGQAADRQAFSS